MSILINRGNGCAQQTQRFWTIPIKNDDNSYQILQIAQFNTAIRWKLQKAELLEDWHLSWVKVCANDFSCNFFHSQKELFIFLGRVSGEPRLKTEKIKLIFLSSFYQHFSGVDKDMRFPMYFHWSVSFWKKKSNTKSRLLPVSFTVQLNEELQSLLCFSCMTDLISKTPALATASYWLENCRRIEIVNHMSSSSLGCSVTTLQQGPWHTLLHFPSPLCTRHWPGSAEHRSLSSLMPGRHSLELPVNDKWEGLMLTWDSRSVQVCLLPYLNYNVQLACDAADTWTCLSPLVHEN